MRYLVTLFLILIFTSIDLPAQEASIQEHKVKMKTYMYSDPDPVPDMFRNYPYYRFDGFRNEGVDKEWNMVIMENKYIKVYITPEIGGKIWGAIEKSTGGEFLYFNDVVKFRDVAQRGPWTSGGLEYNFGIMGHVSTCATPQDYVLSENDDGSVSCTIGAMDFHTQTKWTVEVILPADKAFVKTKASWFNTNNKPVSFYHYMNAAAKADGNLEFIYPGSHYIGHPGDVHGWSEVNGHDVSFYENNNFGSYKSYHVLNSYSDYMGGYWHDDDFGFGHLVDYTEMPGKKLWIWGLSRQGMIWEGLLTDTKGQYIEFQSGKSFNQAAGSSSLTPFKHSEFIPYDTDITTELWFPLKETGGMVAASEYAVLNTIRENDQLTILLSALQELDTELMIMSEGNEIDSKVVKLKPLEILSFNIDIDENSEYTFDLGEELLHYSSNREDLIVERPLYPNDDFNWDSAVGLFTRGLELEKQQIYDSGNDNGLTPHDYYMKSLKIDPAYSPALNRLALSCFRRVEFEKALEYICKSLSIDTYDPEANYIYGLINRKLGNTADAKSGFSIAAQLPLYRSAAYTELADIFLLEKKPKKCLFYADKALSYNKFNLTALEIQILAYHLMGDNKMKFESLAKVSELDKTSIFNKYFELLGKNEDMSGLNELITNELPSESYLDLAIKMYRYGFKRESIEILKTGPEHALLYLWLAFLDKENQVKWLGSALDLSPYLVFPYRDETLKILQHFVSFNNNWKLKYYAGLIYWKKGRFDEARSLFDQCGDDPAFAPFYLAKAELFDAQTEVVKGSLEKAKEIDGENWRVDLALSKMYMNHGEYELAEEITWQSLKKNPERSVLGLNYGISLLKLEKYRQCVSFLESFELIPFEGAVMGRNVYHEAAVKSAFDEIRKSNYKKAIVYAEKALFWPENLGSGKPYDPDERLDNYILAYCNDKLDRSEIAQSYYRKVMDFSPEGDAAGDAFLYLQILAEKEVNGVDAAENRFERIVKQYPDDIYVKWINGLNEGYSPGMMEEIKLPEEENADINNDFLLVNELLSIINQLD
jgi:tetratricopeptide (TPR) repeat protein